jgi:hypothetical protein
MPLPSEAHRAQDAGLTSYAVAYAQSSSTWLHALAPQGEEAGGSSVLCPEFQTSVPAPGPLHALQQAGAGVEADAALEDCVRQRGSHSLTACLSTSCSCGTKQAVTGTQHSSVASCASHPLHSRLEAPAASLTDLGPSAVVGSPICQLQGSAPLEPCQEVGSDVAPAVTADLGGMGGVEFSVAEHLLHWLNNDDTSAEAELDSFLNITQEQHDDGWTAAPGVPQANPSDIDAAPERTDDVHQPALNAAFGTAAQQHAGGSGACLQHAVPPLRLSLVSAVPLPDDSHSHGSTDQRLAGTHLDLDISNAQQAGVGVALRVRAQQPSHKAAAAVDTARTCTHQETAHAEMPSWCMPPTAPPFPSEVDDPILSPTPLHVETSELAEQLCTGNGMPAQHFPNLRSASPGAADSDLRAASCAPSHICEAADSATQLQPVQDGSVPGASVKKTNGRKPYQKAAKAIAAAVTKERELAASRQGAKSAAKAAGPRKKPGPKPKSNAPALQQALRALPPHLPAVSRTGRPASVTGPGTIAQHSKGTPGVKAVCTTAARPYKAQLSTVLQQRAQGTSASRNLAAEFHGVKQRVPTSLLEMVPSHASSNLLSPRLLGGKAKASAESPQAVKSPRTDCSRQLIARQRSLKAVDQHWSNCRLSKDWT